MEFAIGPAVRAGCRRHAHALQRPVDQTCVACVHRACGFVEEGRLVGEFRVEGASVDDVLTATRLA